MNWSASDGGAAVTLGSQGAPASDFIAISGTLTQSTGSTFIFDFGNSGTLSTTYTLIDLVTTTFSDFSNVNLSGGTGVFSFSSPDSGTLTVIDVGGALNLAAKSAAQRLLDAATLTSDLRAAALAAIDCSDVTLSGASLAEFSLFADALIARQATLEVATINNTTLELRVTAGSDAPESIRGRTVIVSIRLGAQ